MGGLERNLPFLINRKKQVRTAEAVRTCFLLLKIFDQCVRFLAGVNADTVIFERGAICGGKRANVHIQRSDQVAFGRENADFSFIRPKNKRIAERRRRQGGFGFVGRDRFRFTRRVNGVGLRGN